MDDNAFAAACEAQRRALRVHYYRMTGSFDEAEDLVQETMLRAWRSRAGFEGRAQLGTWLYRIATNVCLDAPSTSSCARTGAAMPSSTSSAAWSGSPSR